MLRVVSFFSPGRLVYVLLFPFSAILNGYKFESEDDVDVDAVISAINVGRVMNTAELIGPVHVIKATTPLFHTRTHTHTQRPTSTTGNASQCNSGFFPRAEGPSPFPQFNGT